MHADLPISHALSAQRASFLDVDSNGIAVICTALVDGLSAEYAACVQGILGAGDPLQIFYAVVCAVAVLVVDVRLRKWRSPVECGAYEAMHVANTPTRSIPEVHHGIEACLARLDNQDQVAPAKARRPLSAFVNNTVDAAHTSDAGHLVVWKVFNRSPFFASLNFNHRRTSMRSSVRDDADTLCGVPSF